MKVKERNKNLDLEAPRYIFKSMNCISESTER